jgi:hypothetical protein
VFGICFDVLGSEDDHDTILQEVIELNRVAIQPLAFKVVNSTEILVECKICSLADLLLLRKFDLEANYVAVLNLALNESTLCLHELDHAWFNFLSEKLTVNIPAV